MEEPAVSEDIAPDLSATMSTDSAGDMVLLVDESIQALRQLDALLCRMDEDTYRHTLGATGNHAAGKHVRHIIDHYDAFFHAFDQPSSVLLVNYENRRREARLESNPAVASRRVQAVIQSLRQLIEVDHQLPVIHVSVCAQRTIELESSIGRELIFLSSHTIHHMAIIGMLADLLGVPVSETFGVHPSTLRYRSRHALRQPATPER